MNLEKEKEEDEKEKEQEEDEVEEVEEVEEDNEEEEEEEEEEVEEEEEEDEDANDDMLNPCGCLRGRKCFFINALELLKLKKDMDNDQINNSIKQMLQLKCINSSENKCQSFFYPLCVEVRNKKTNKIEKQLLTKCKRCFDNTNKTSDKVFQILTDKQG